MKKIFLITVFLLFAPVISSAVEQPESDSNLEIAANFTLPDLTGKKTSLSDFKGKPIVLFFWTTWCPYCRDELRKLNTLYPQLTGEGWEVLAIDTGEAADKVENMVRSYNLGYRVLLDKDTSTAGAYAIFGVPTYIIVDKKGYIRFQNNIFPQDYKELIL